MKNNKAENTRIKCGKVIERSGVKYPNLIHITSDGNDYTKKNRRHHFDVGIAEANLINLATGFAIKDFPVIVNGITSFVLYNAYLQIRNNLCYPNLKVVILGIGSGLSYGHLGFSHHSLEDISILYTLPNMKIYLPCDANEAASSIEDALEREGPSFIRIRNGMEPIIYSPKQVKSINFEKPFLLKEGKQILIISYGATILSSLQAAEELDKHGISTGVLNVNSLMIYDISKIIEFTQGYNQLVIVEEHYVDNGIGAIIINKLGEKIQIPIIKIGIPKEFVKFGASSDELFSYYRINSKSLVHKIITLHEQSI